MANFLTVRKYAGLAPAVWNLEEAYYYNNRKYSGLAPATWNLEDSYYYNVRKYSAFPQGESFIINNAPVVDNPIPDQEATQDITFDFTFAEDTFSDPEAQPLTYTATLENNDPLPSWLTFTGVTRRFVGTPLNADVGVINIKVTATDVGLLSVFDVFQLIINNVNDGPTVDQGIQDQNATTNLDFNFQFPLDAFEDIDGDLLSFVARLSNGDELPNWLTFDSATRTFSGVPPDDSVGNIEVEVIAEDGNP